MASRSPAALSPVVAVALVALGCGTQGDASGLPDRWPRPGLSGYVLYNSDDPLLLSLPGWDLDQPAAEPGPSGGLVVWGRMAPKGMAGPSQLFRATVQSLDSADDPAPALQATLPWEGTSLRGPCVAVGLPLLLYQAEDGSVGVGRQDGDAITKAAAPLGPAVLLGGGRQVGRVGAAIRPDPAGDRLRLYYTVDDSEVYTAEAAVAAVQAFADGATAPVAWQVRPARLAAADFLVPPGDSKAVPADHIADLSVRRVITPAGRARWDLFVVASAASGRTPSLVAAAAYEEGGSELYAAMAAPLLKSGEGALSSPTVTSFAGGQLLLVGLRSVQQGVAAAVLPFTSP